MDRNLGGTRAQMQAQVVPPEVVARHSPPALKSAETL